MGEIDARGQSKSPGSSFRVGGITEAASERGVSRAPPALTHHLALPPTATTASKTGLPELTQAAELRRLSPQELKRRYPVRLQGVVTYHDRIWQNTVVQDETGGIFLDPRGGTIAVEPDGADPTRPGLRYGLRVEVRGYSDPGGFAPVVIEPRVRVLGEGQLPAPKVLPFERFAFGQEECQWVEVTGIVRAVHDASEGSMQARGHILFKIATSGGSFKAWIPNWESQPVPVHLVDCRVSLRGVCGASSNKRGQFQGIDVMVPDPAEIRLVEAAAPDPFNLASFPIDRLLRYSTNVIPEHRIKVTGVVAYHQVGADMYIQDDTVGLRVLTVQTNRAHPGDRVEVVGFIGIEGSGPVLEGASFRRLSSGSPPRPVRLNADELLRQKAEDELVQIEGRLLSCGRQGTKGLLVLQSENVIINAELEEARDPVEFPSPGSLVQLTGINVVDLDPLYRWPQKFRILLRSPADMVVLRLPNWWTSARLARALGAVTVTALIGSIWLMMLSRKNLALRQAEAALQEANNELEQRVRERTAALSQANTSLQEQIAARARVEERLRQTQKLEAVGQLAGGVAHDFNNILSSMLLNLGLLRINAELSPEIQAILLELQAQARRAASLTRQLLMYGQRQMIQRQTIDLNEVVGQVLQILPRVVGDGIVLEDRRTTDLPSVEADPSLIEQVMLNLGSNARDAMPRGGKLTIGTECVSLADANLDLDSEARAGRYIRVTVADTGSGMDNATLKRIFEPFFTTKEVGKGTGLGLASVYGIMKQHRGWIEVESALGRGTTFRLYLPVAAAPDQEKTPPQ